MLRIFFLLFPRGALNERPYRLLFPLGLIGLFYGMLRMVLPFSPGNIYWHREAMIGLFLLPVAAGFLFTAGPRFFASNSARNGEIVLVLVLVTAMYGSSLAGFREAFTIFKALLVLLILVFIAERFFRRRSGIPVFAPFLFAGPAVGLLGALAQLASLYDGSPVWLELSRSLYFHGMFWILFFGVGTKFFPVVTGTARSRSITAWDRLVASSHSVWLAMALLLIGTFVLEGFGWIRGAMILRAFIILFLAKEGWLLFAKSPRRGVVTFFLKLGLWTALLAHFVFPFFPDQRVHFYHAVFVGGFLLGALIVMGRVSLAHEGLDLNAEVRSKLAAVAFGFIYLALWTRVSAQLTKGYVLHLKSAAILVILAAIILIGLYVALWRRARSRRAVGPSDGA